MKKLVETARLIWREFSASDTKSMRANDAKFMLELLNSEGWVEFIGDRGVHTVAAAQQYIDERLVSYYEKNGFGFLMVTLKNTDETPVGICGFIKRGGLDYIDFGFAFLPQFMDKGYAFEISTALLRYAKEQLNIEKLLAITTLTNTRSIKLLEKLGFQFDKIVNLNDEELRLFALDMA